MIRALVTKELRETWAYAALALALSLFGSAAHAELRLQPPDPTTRESSHRFPSASRSAKMSRNSG